MMRGEYIGYDAWSLAIDINQREAKHEEMNHTPQFTYMVHHPVCIFQVGHFLQNDSKDTHDDG
jgi:hypothetical protein